MAIPPLTGSSHLGVTENQKQWLVAGIALNNILIPGICPFVEQGVNTEYNNLKASHNIHGQSTSGRLQRWPPGKFLKYENINGNDVHPRLPGGRFNYSLFDCQVISHVDFARLYVENYMAKFTAFDEHCDASAVLLLLGRVPAFNMVAQTAADDVRSTVWNDWVHCVFSKWDQPKFLKSFSGMEQLVRSMALPTADETKLLGELKDWESKGTHLWNSTVDPALLQLVQQELKSLHDVVDNMSVEFVEDKIKVQHSLGSISAALEEVKQQVQRLEAGQKNLELTQSRFNDFQVCPERLAGIISRDYKRAVLCPSPWCEDELQLELSKIFTRLKIVGKKKERARLTDEIVNMTDVFKPHEKCEEPRVVLIEGQPGMGKTTYCQKLAYNWSMEDISAKTSFPKVKMLLVLKCRDIKTTNIEEAIDDQLLPIDADEEEKEKFFHFIRCNQSKILLVLDGLDELSDDHFKALLPVIQGKIFSNMYLMLTAWHEAGMKVWQHCDTLLEIVGYTSEDADSYITKYFSNHEDPSLAEKLISELERDHRLRELTVNPLNTALLCLLCEDTEGVFPSNRTKMYSELVSCTIRRYFARKSVPLDARDPVETFSDNLNQLGKVALKALKADRMYFSEEEIKCESIDFLRLCFLSQQASASKLRPMPCYAFTHKTFQEYFAAYHLTLEILSGDKDTADTLLAQLSPVGKYWQLWEFLLTMVASKSGEAATLVISGFCAAFQRQQTELTEEQNSQDSDCDDDDDTDVSDDGNIDICKDLLNVFPDCLFPWSLTEDEQTRASTLNAAFSLISKCEGGKNELTDSQKKMIQVLAESFPIHKLETGPRGTGMPSNVKILCEYLKSNSTLKLLSWRHQLDDSVLGTIEHVLRSNRTLKTLDLFSRSSAFMFGERRTPKHFSLTTILANALHFNCTVTHLNLQRRSILSPGANEISQALQSNHTLTHMNLQENGIDDSAAENFAGALRSGCALMYLDLSSNRIGDSGAVALAKALESNRTLTYLDLGYPDSIDHACLEAIPLMRGGDPKRNRIGDSGATAFAQALRSNSVLAHLNLQNNRISDLGAAALGLSLKSNCTLAHLCLRGNRIENTGDADLGHALQVNCGIVNLDLRRNDLSQSEASAESLAEQMDDLARSKEPDVTMSCQGSPKTAVDDERVIWNAAIKFEFEHEECVRVLPYLNNGDVEIHLYVYCDRSGIPIELKHAAQAFFEPKGYKLIWADLYNDAFKLLKVTSIKYSSGEPTRLEASQVDQIDEIINKNLHVFTNNRNVTAVQPSFKVRHSVQTEEACIMVYVLGKGKIPLGESAIPCTIGSYPVDIVNGFFVRTKGPQKVTEAHKQDDYLRFGTSIGVKGKQSSGTLGAIVKDVNSGTLYALSCDHVMNDAVESEIIHPGLDVYLNYLHHYLKEYQGWIERIPRPPVKLPPISDIPEETAELQTKFSKLKIEKENYSASRGHSAAALKNSTTFEGVLEKAFSREPRVIAKYLVGVSGNATSEENNGRERFIDAAISELNNDEVRRLRVHEEVEIIGTPYYPSGECISAIGDEQELFKSGSATGFTKSRHLVDESSEVLPSKPEFQSSDNRTWIHVKCSKCNGQQSCVKCKGDGWYKRCLCIQQVGNRSFSDKGDSGAVIFAKDENGTASPGFGIIFGALETQYFRFAIASPLGISLKALSRKVSEMRPNQVSCDLKLASSYV